MTVIDWIPFKKRLPDEEEHEHHPDWVWVWDCPLPDDGQEILVSRGGYVWVDEWEDEGNDGSGLASGNDCDEGCAWMPMPEPYKAKG